MKNTIAVFLALALALCVSASPVQAQTETSFRNQVVTVIASDSTITNSTTTYSAIFQMFVKTQSFKTSINHLDGSVVLVAGYQIRDSMNYELSLQFGQISGGTLDKTFTNKIIDTLTASKKYLLIDLSSYALCPEIRLKAVGLSAGNGSASYPTKLNARVGAAGKPYPTSADY